MNKYSVVLVGIGLVGSEILKIMKQRDFPAKDIKILARRKRTEVIDGVEYPVESASMEGFDDVDIALFAGTEGAKGASRQYGWEAVKKGAVVVDNGDDFRMDPRVPLVVPEVNPDALKEHQGLVANPNCSTIQMVMAMAPLHRIARIKRVVVSTYQAVSGTGSSAVRELENQVLDVPQGKSPVIDNYPYQIFSNLIPQISSLKDEYPGYYGEEIKMIKETHKIFNDPKIGVTATCVRVPVINAHSETLNIQFEKEITVEEARAALEESPGVKVLDDPASSVYPMPLEASGLDEVFVGRIRQDSTAPNSLNLWVVSDNIRKGAALNAVQIAEKLIEMGLIGK
ncbi:MAG TPA: aspartate-semialdehyde dehydrogenase [Spirochaetes bacterium]|nr:aspartate-semialdehyde dehydrogenase [Spirochaetota bacterium]